MDTDSSEEREIFHNRFSSSSSSDEQDDECNQQALSGAGPITYDSQAFENDLFPFHGISTEDLMTEYMEDNNDDDDNSLSCLDRLFLDSGEHALDTKMHSMGFNASTDSHVGLFDDVSGDDDNDSDDYDDDANNDNDDDDLRFGLLCETRYTNRPVSDTSRDNDRLSSKTKAKVDDLKSRVLDDILREETTASTDRGAVETSNNSPKMKRGQPIADSEFCCICRDEHTDPVVLPKCSHKYCRGCIDEYFKIKPVCPECFMPYGIITGNQPPGHMSHSVSKKLILGGSRVPGAIVINYSFENGKQTSEHPNPGVMYHGTCRTAYLPDNKEGHKVLTLLKKAFDRRLVFTVGRSRTTGADNQVTWNDIHHKTSPTGGQESFGYPDPTYLQRVQQELAAVGVTEDS